MVRVSDLLGQGREGRQGGEAENVHHPFVQRRRRQLCALRLRVPVRHDNMVFNEKSVHGFGGRLAEQYPVQYLARHGVH